MDKCENEDLAGRTAEDKTVTTLKQEPPDVADDDVVRTEIHDEAESEDLKFKEDKDRVEENTPKIEAKREHHEERHGEVSAKEEVPAKEEEEEKRGVVEGPVTAIKTESEERQSRSPSSEESNSLEKAAEEERTTARVNALKKGMLISLQSTLPISSFSPCRGGR